LIAHAICIDNATPYSVTHTVREAGSACHCLPGRHCISLPHANAEFNPADLSVTITGSDAAGENFLSIEGALTASGITFLPASFSSSDQLRAPLLVSGGQIFFTDSSNQPLKKVAVGGGATTALAGRFGAAENVVLHGGNVYWVDGGQLNETSLLGRRPCSRAALEISGRGSRRISSLMAATPTGQPARSSNSPSSCK
jgi:hypothetical protein